MFAADPIQPAEGVSGFNIVSHLGEAITGSMRTSAGERISSFRPIPCSPSKRLGLLQRLFVPRHIAQAILRSPRKTQQAGGGVPSAGRQTVKTFRSTGEVREQEPREAGMTRSPESSNVRLSHLQKIRADLFRRRAALARLRKEVQLTEAALRAKIAYQDNGERCSGPDLSILRVAPDACQRWAQESLIGLIDAQVIGVVPDGSKNHPAFCQLGFAAQATGVAFHGRTKSPSGSSDFDTSEKREGKGGATDEGPIHCLPLVADTAVVRVWFFPPPTFDRA